eukprot:g78438.t1
MLCSYLLLGVLWRAEVCKDRSVLNVDIGPVVRSMQGQNCRISIRCVTGREYPSEWTQLVAEYELQILRSGVMEYLATTSLAPLH